MSRAPLDTAVARRPTSGGVHHRPPGGHQVRESSRPRAPPRCAEVGRPRQLDLGGLVGRPSSSTPCSRHHQAHLVEAARVLNAHDRRPTRCARDWDLGPGRDLRPGGAPLPPAMRHPRAQAEVGVDADRVHEPLARAAIPKDYVVSRSVAVDGTDVETWGALQVRSLHRRARRRAAETQLRGRRRRSIRGPPPAKKPVKTAKVFGVGADGRKQYTADPDARAGHRSATGNRRLPDPTSATSSTWPSRPATCAGPTTSTRPPSVPRCPA